jgi:hypothetical protein
MHHAENSSSFYVRVPARVLGCLRAGEITVILFPGHGLVITEAIPTYLIPEELRMPNSEFYILFKHPDRKLIKIVNLQEFCSEIDGMSNA